MDESEEIVEVAPCRDCGELITLGMMRSHRRNCQARKPAAVERGARTSQNRSPAVVGNEEESAPPPVAVGSIVSASTTDDDDDDNESQDEINPTVAAAGIRPTRRSHATGVARRQNVVDLIDESQQQQQQPDDWACTRCTLLNPPLSSYCAACGFNKYQAFARSARHRPAVPSAFMRTTSSPGRHRRGHRPGSNSAAAHQQGRRPNSASRDNGAQRSRERARRSHSPMQRMQPRRSTQHRTSRSGRNQPPVLVQGIRVSRSPGIVRGHPMGVPAAGRMRATYIHHPSAMDPMIQQIMQQMFSNHHRFPMAAVMGAPDIDRMSYEQLLRTFGDGTENLRAGEEQISTLPTSTVQDVNDLHEDKRQCAICLEEFCSGETMKTMPCLHVFHDGCLDKWLRTNGACPICKHRLNSDN